MRQNGKLKIHIHESLGNISIDEFDWRGDKLRLLYYLFLEIVDNAIKYGCSSETRISIRPFIEHNCSGLRISNKCDTRPKTERKFIKSNPYIASEGVFTEGDTGLKKIAALAASINEQEIKMLTYGHGDEFRMKIPLVQGKWS